MSHTNIRDIFPVASRTDTFNEFRTYPQFNTLTPDLKKKLIDFMSGKSTLPLTYDPIFKKIFNPDIYPERLSSFISSIIGVPVTVKCVLSNEEHLLHGTALLIMDILVELHDGSIDNIDELQSVINEYPWVEPIYRDMAMYLENPEEVLNMFSEALRILDQNTIQFMIDDMKKQLVEKDAELAEQGNTIAEQENTIAEQGNTIAEQGNTITEQENTITEQKNIIAEQKNKQSVLIDEINKLKEQINNLNIKLEN